MANRGNANPFEQDGPTAYDNWNYVVGQAHGQLLIDLSNQVELLRQEQKNHNLAHQAASKAVLDLPTVTQSEKPS